MTYRRYCKIGLIALGVATALVFSGCETAGEEEAQVVEEQVDSEIENNQVEKLLTVETETINDKTEAYNIEIELPVISGFADLSFQDQVNDEMKTNALEYAESIKKLALEIEDEGYLTSPYYFGLLYDVVMNNSAYLTLEVNYSEYTGGAHGNYAIAYIVYDVSEDKQVVLTDIFDETKDYISEINTALDEQVALAREESEYGENLYSSYIGVDENMTYFISEEGFGVQFQPYEIGSYAEGAPSFIIPYDRLESVLKIKNF